LKSINQKKRAMLFWCAALPALPLLKGCFTQRMWEEESYRENISTVLISKDEKNLIVVTRQFHYIFDAPTTIVTSLKSSFHHLLSAGFSNFYVDASGKTTGLVELTLRNAKEPEIQAALNAGFTRAASQWGPQAQVKVALQGIRYVAANVQAPQSYKLNEIYTVNITEQQSINQKVGHALATPITLAADGLGLLFVGVPLLVFFVATGSSMKIGM
jgi:hypothetical protein